MADEKEVINHPNHYQQQDDPDGTYEAIKVIEAMGHGEGFVMGNAMKYLMRAGKKEGESEETDLRKAAWYLNRRREQIAKEGQK